MWLIVIRNSQFAVQLFNCFHEDNKLFVGACFGHNDERSEWVISGRKQLHTCNLVHFE